MARKYDKLMTSELVWLRSIANGRTGVPFLPLDYYSPNQLRQMLELGGLIAPAADAADPTRYTIGAITDAMITASNAEK